MRTVAIESTGCTGSRCIRFWKRTDCKSRERTACKERAAEHIMHVQKALSQMNLQVHHVLSDITGLSGLAILDAILGGERDPVKLASLCNGRVKSPREKVAKSLRLDF